jgi:hypothetical protein
VAGARSNQVRFEEAAMHCLTRLQRLVPSPRLAMAGGCALNSVANARIHRETPFKQHYLQAARRESFRPFAPSVLNGDQFLTTGRYGEDTIQPRLLGNSQERRRWIKALIIRLPFEHWLWFGYHYVARLGFLEGRPGLIACQIRASYIAQVRAKRYELRLRVASDAVPH